MRDFGNSLISLLDRVKDRKAAIKRMCIANELNGWPECDNLEDTARSYLVFLEKGTSATRIHLCNCKDSQTHYLASWHDEGCEFIKWFQE